MCLGVWKIKGNGVWGEDYPPPLPEMFEYTLVHFFMHNARNRIRGFAFMRYINPRLIEQDGFKPPE